MQDLKDAYQKNLGMSYLITVSKEILYVISHYYLNALFNFFTIPLQLQLLKPYLNIIPPQETDLINPKFIRVLLTFLSSYHPTIDIKSN